MLLVICGVYQRDRPIGHAFVERFQCRWIFLQFTPITFFKIVPSRRIMPKPSPQFAAGCYILEPKVHVRFRFGHTARPKTLYQDTQAIIRRTRQIHPFNFDRWHCVPPNRMPHRDIPSTVNRCFLRQVPIRHQRLRGPGRDFSISAVTYATAKSSSGVARF